MAKSKNTENADENVETLANGVRIAGNIEHGKPPALNPALRGMKARGELDENNQPVAADEKVANDKGAVAAAEEANAARSEKEKATDAKVEVLNEAKAETANGPVKVEEQQYVGPITATAIAAATGQEVSYFWEQAQPTTVDGLFWSFIQAHPSARRDTFKVDPTNTDDPTKRTYLERTRPVRVPAPGAVGTTAV